MVSLVYLHNMKQDREEGVRNFAAHLSGQADVCKFTVTCVSNEKVNYRDQVVRNVLIHGLEDQEIQQDVMRTRTWS